MPGQFERIFGAPFKGSIASLNRDSIDPAFIDGSNSKNVMWDPQHGALVRRPGSATIYDDPAAMNGLLESKWNAHGRQLFEIQSPSATDGMPSIAALFTDEADNEGTLYWHDNNVAGAAGNRQLALDYGALHYPSDGGTPPKTHFVMIPVKVKPTANNGLGMSRGATASQRKVLASGSRSSIRMGGQVYLPNLTGSPLQWNQRYNPDGTHGTEIERLLPWGHQPPPWIPEIPDANFTGAATAGGWISATRFYVGVSYLFRDGAHSAITDARDPNALLANGYGLVKVPAGGPWLTMQWDNVPLGPKEDCVARVLWRSPGVTGTNLPNARDMRIAGVIRDNISTSYKDTLATDAGLEPQYDADINQLLVGSVLRRDHQWCPRARGASIFDERAVVWYTSPNPAAFIAVGCGASVSNNQDEDSYAVTRFTISIRDDQTGGGAYQCILDDTVAATDTLALATYDTVQKLLDYINSTTAGSAARKWRAQGVPGSNVSAPSTDLEVTQVVIPCTSLGGTHITTAKNTRSIQKGMRVDGMGATAGTLVTAVGAGSFDVDTAIPAGGPTNLTIGWDYGGLLDSSLPGAQRAYGATYYALMYFSEAAMARYGTNKQHIQWTLGGPTNARNAARSFVSDRSTHRQVPDSAGAVIAVLALHAETAVRAIVICTGGIYKLVNTRGAASGEDADYRVVPLNEIRGCISWDGWAVGHGHVGYLTSDGWVETDGEVERLTTQAAWMIGGGAITQQGGGSGEWGYEIAKSVASAAGDTTDSEFHAMTAEGKTYFGYRALNATLPNRMLVQDFLLGKADRIGLDQLFGPDGAPWGISSQWSNPGGIYRPGCMGTVRSAAGLQYYFIDDGNQGFFGDGRIFQFNLPPFADDTNKFDTIITTPCDRCGTRERKDAQAVELLISKDTGTLALLVYRGLDFTAPITLTLTTGKLGTYNGKAGPERVYVPLPIGARGSTEALTVVLSWTDSINQKGFSVHMIRLVGDTLETVN